jgi:hypothetical protein
MIYPVLSLGFAFCRKLSSPSKFTLPERKVGTNCKTQQVECNKGEFCAPADEHLDACVVCCPGLSVFSDDPTPITLEATMGCAVRDSLLKQYRLTVATYLRSIRRMRRRLAIIPHSDFRVLIVAAKDCLMQSKAAQRLLQQHVTTHHCHRPTLRKSTIA